MANKKLIGTIILVFLAAGVGGGFIGYYFPEIEGGSFNPTIDGNFSNSDGWRFADYKFIEYLTLDPDSENTNNYFYVHLTTNYLYILIDFCGDISGDTTDEWLTVWIDTDNSLTGGLDDLAWNSTSSDAGEQMFCYFPESDTFTDTFKYFTVSEFNATLNSSKVEIAHGFQKTINFNTAHRIFEIRINKNTLDNIGVDNFNIAFLGYGTAAYYNSDFWGAPSNFAEVFYMDSQINEDRYFRCEV